MCDVCVINAVKERMLSRRAFFKSGLTAGAAVAAASTFGATTSAMAAGHGGVTDMTHAYDDAFPTYFGAPGIKADQQFKFADNGFNLFQLTINEHTGTHVDAPLHFSADGKSVSELAVEGLVCPLAVIDTRGRADAAADP